MNVVRPILVGVVVTNIVNAFGNWVFVYGHLGMPALGAVGFGLRDGRGARRARHVPLVVDRARANGGGRRDFTTSPLTIDAARMWRLVRLGHAGGVAAGARGRRVRGRRGARRTHLAGGARGEPDRAEHRELLLHGAVRAELGRGGARRAGRGPRRSGRRAARGLVRRSGSPRRAAVVIRRASSVDPGSVPPIVHDRSDRARGRHAPCCWSARCFSRSTDSRRWRPAPCVDSATPARRCSSTSSGTGSSACRSAMRSVSGSAGASSGSGRACR